MRPNRCLSLLLSLNQSDADIDRQWMEVTRRRRDELRSGQVAVVSSEAVLARLRNRFPFGVVYDVDGNRVRVLAVMHLRREPHYWEDRY